MGQGGVSLVVRGRRGGEVVASHLPIAGDPLPVDVKRSADRVSIVTPHDQIVVVEAAIGYIGIPLETLGVGDGEVVAQQLAFRRQSLAIDIPASGCCISVVPPNRQVLVLATVVSQSRVPLPSWLL